MNFLSKVYSQFFLVGHERTLRTNKNIAASFVIKGTNIASGLLLVPLTINYLNPTKYGIWITLTSVIGWFGFFNIGLGNGLRLRLGEAMASRDNILARKYVSTTYGILSIIVICMILVFLLIYPFCNWIRILNVANDLSISYELRILVIVVFTFFCINLVLSLINTVLMADQKPAKAAAFDLSGKLLSLLIIFVLTKTNGGSLLYLGIVMACIPSVVFLISSTWLFNGQYEIYSPSFRYFDLSKANDLLTVGVKYFFVRIAAILLYGTNNIIIAQLFGPAEVTPYNVAFKYFSVLMMVFSIVMTPFWSAFTEAWIKKDVNWIIHIFSNLFKFWGILFLSALLMLILSPKAYLFWVGESVVIPFSVSLLVSVWILINAWNGIFSHFLNGIGIIRLQLYLGMGGAVVNIPLAIYLGKKLGISGVLIANIVAVIPGIFLYFIQYKKLLNNTATGIWKK